MVFPFHRLLGVAFMVALAGCSAPKTTLVGTTQYLPEFQYADSDLVDLRSFMPDLSIDLRYATAQNITRRPLYPQTMPILLQRSTAEKLKRAQERLRKEGYALQLWDAWRPTEVQHQLIDKAGRSGLFLDPKDDWSRHCSGTAVDVSLVDLSGNEQRMPTHHDEGGDRAAYNYSGHDPVTHRNLTLLQHAMADSGFSLLASEWWHFNDLDYLNHPPPPVSASQRGIQLPRAH
jgi:D-alanyl-D-alanine dipeptidase